MCGIVGIIGQRDSVQFLMSGLQRLEYRGYDSAGIATITTDGNLQSRRSVGKVKLLADLVEQQPLQGKIGIAHTRWATHGKPCEVNAHPHLSNDDIAVVHNGIIENYEAKRESLKSAGYQFSSETDTEVVAHLLHASLAQGMSLLAAVQNLASELEGAFALGIISTQFPDRLLAVRKGSSPLVIGLGQQENFIASDPLALLPVTNQVIYLQEGDVAEITQQQVHIYDHKGQPVERSVHTITANISHTERGSFRHYMQKEIFEQPQAIAATLQGRINQQKVFEEAFGATAKALFKQVKQVHITACGTSYYAGMLGRYWIEELAGIPCQVEVASEYRYRSQIVLPGTLFVTLSQSGETADTLGALQAAQSKNYLASLAICNIAESSLVRHSDLAFLTQAGPEIGVASTKAFTTQLVALLLLSIALSRQQAHWNSELEAELVKQLHDLPALLENTLSLDEQIKSLASLLVAKQHALFLGRGAAYPIALEGALKLKEISYIHAEAYPAGELKHGPLALVDHTMPVIALVPPDSLQEKTKSNLCEVQARGGELFIFADKQAGFTTGATKHVIYMPQVSKYLSPIIYTVPLQLLAYHVAVQKGTDVDQPRNLAKSVTVE
jgi:glucosamine--fructose-6-phosphate aminotransferase (isomerizing)